jgi:pimeloyl-ACP methyl ester carboxylesterase
VSPARAPLTLQAVTVAGYPGVEVRPERMTSLPPILWLHGVTNLPGYAEPFLLEFARMGFPALALARRGRLGVPPRDPRSISVDDYLADTIRVFDATRGEAVVLGHSQGGLLALKLADLRRPPAVVLLAPLPPRGILAAAPRLQTLPASLSSLAAILAGARFQPTLRQATSLFLNNVPRHLRPEVYRAGRAGLRPLPPGRLLPRGAGRPRQGCRAAALRLGRPGSHHPCRRGAGRPPVWGQLAEL